MQILVFTKSFSAGWPPGAILPTVLLPFNPVKLVCLIVWVYLCLYIVQYIQFSPLVPKNRRLIASVAALFAGPILLFALVIIDVVRKSYTSHYNVLEIIKEHLKNMLAGISTSGITSTKADSKIRLLDSSGTELKEIYGHGKSKRQDSHILDLTEQIVADALERRASDILIDPRDDSTYTIRLRIDGVLRVVKQLDTDISKAVVNSIKAVSSMDISEKRRPQDGAFSAKKGQTTASFRVASAGVLNGEKLSIRVLNQDATTFKLVDLGLAKKQRAIIESAINKPSGMMLVCGPTGSGKTTTMYAMLNQIDRFTRNIITVEDPIEAVLPETSQIEVNPKADITFAKSLRSILRQDPDVICVGEIRDEETAEIALRASQTGHLVLATIHCDSHAMALVRLLDLGISSILISSGLDVLVSQRLLRQLCDHCKMPAQLTESQIHYFSSKGVNYENIFSAKGCKKCYGTGYRGRMGIFDIVVLNDELKTRIANGDLSINELRKDDEKAGRASLRKQGLRMVLSGKTSLEELKRVLG